MINVLQDLLVLVGVNLGPLVNIAKGITHAPAANTAAANTAAAAQLNQSQPEGPDQKKLKCCATSCKLHLAVSLLP
jgi:hypothetical protein